METIDLRFGTNYSGKNFEEAWETYKRRIISGSTALIVGPSISIGADPSLLQTAFRLGSNGIVFVCDPQENFLEHFRDSDKLAKEASKASGERIVGYGDTRSHLRQLQILRNLGVPLATTYWLGTSSNVAAMELQDSHVDYIVDHGTSIFIATQGKPENSQAFPLLKKIYSEYRRVLKPQGSLILQRNLTRYRLTSTDIIEQALDELGFLIDEKKTVRDVFQIEIDHEVFNRIRADCFEGGYDNFGHGDRLLYMLQASEPPMIRNTSSDHFSPDLLLANSTKTA